MADYQFLTPEEQAQIVAEVMAARPDPDAVLLEREKAHFRSVIEAKIGLHEPPDPYTPVDVTKETADVAVLAAEAAKLPEVTAQADEAIKVS